MFYSNPASSDICVKAKEGIIIDPLTISELFKKFHSNIANDLVQKLSAAAKTFGIESVMVYCNNMFIFDNNRLTFQTVQQNSIQISLKHLAAGIDNISGRFLKNGADVLAISIIQICNLSIKLSHFPKHNKAVKLKKGLIWILKNLGQFLFYQ